MLHHTWFCCSPWPNVQPSWGAGIDRTKCIHLCRKKVNVHDISIYFHYGRCLICGVVPLMVYLSVFLEEWIVLGDLDGEALWVSNQLADGSGSVVCAALDTVPVAIAQPEARGLM